MLVSFKKLNPFFKSKASITNADLSKPISMSQSAKIEKKLFFPTFDSRESIAFWIKFVLFFSLLGMAISISSFNGWWDAWVMFVDGFTAYACIVGTVVGYLHYHRLTLVRYSYLQTLTFFFKTVLVFVPVMTLVASFLTYLITGVSRSVEVLLGYVVSNVLLTWLFSFLMIQFFSEQYDKMQRHYAIYQQKLVEQNEQLKARITPHFFFNMLNTVQSLVESEPKLASEALDKMSKLYRFSFYEPKEIAFTDEIELCQDYLDIERYRFNERLVVTWELPDEDLLYDMVIASLTLQMSIEKMIISVVEITHQTIHIHIIIRWENGVVTLLIITSLPDKVTPPQAEAITKQLSFQVQQDNLQRFFGNDAKISHYIDIQEDIAKAITLDIQYPLPDVAM